MAFWKGGATQKNKKGVARVWGYAPGSGYERAIYNSTCFAMFLV